MAEQPKPTPRERIAEVQAKAAPRLQKAADAASPAVEKAAGVAGKFLGTLRERAKETMKEFHDAYGTEGKSGQTDGVPNGESAPPATAQQNEPAPPAAAPPTGSSGEARPRPRPRPGPR